MRERGKEGGINEEGWNKERGKEGGEGCSQGGREEGERYVYIGGWREHLAPSTRVPSQPINYTHTTTHVGSHFQVKSRRCR